MRQPRSACGQRKELLGLPLGLERKSSVRVRGKYDKSSSKRGKARAEQVNGGTKSGCVLSSGAQRGALELFVDLLGSW